MTNAEKLRSLSVLIVTYRGDELLTTCLNSLSKSCEDHPEIVVVDNAANENTETIVRQYANAKYIAAESNRGFAGGNNLGIYHCTREYVVLLNNDTIVSKEPFSLLINYLENHSYVGVVQGKMVLPLEGGTLDSCGALLTPIGEPLFLNDHAPASTPTHSRPVFAVKGACLLFRKTLLAQLGGCLFYDHFKSYYEDIDFCHRVWLIGKEVHFVDTPPIEHLQGQTAKKFSNVDIVSQSLANQEFSLRTTLGRWGKLSLGVRRLVFRMLQTGIALLKENTFVLSCTKNARQLNKGRKGEAIKIREHIQSLRTMSDSVIFKKVMVKPPWNYYYYLLRGRSDKVLSISHQIAKGRKIT